MAHLVELKDLFTPSTARTYGSFLKDVDVTRALVDPKFDNIEGKPNVVKALRAYVRAKHNRGDIDLSNVHDFFKRGIYEERVIAPAVHIAKANAHDKDKDDTDSEAGEASETDDLPSFTGEDDDIVDIDLVPEQMSCEKCPDCAFLKTTMKALIPHLTDEAKTKLLQTLFDRAFKV